MKRKGNWKKYTMEFISIFIAVVSAFALNNWNDNRRDQQAATKILTEISNGLQKDLDDIKINMGGHREGINACKYWRRVINNQAFSMDSLGRYYIGLTRDFFSAQNNSGYETLKSKGLELLQNDALRFDIISLYEYDYESLKTLEENYAEMQFHDSYFKDFNDKLAPNFEFDSNGDIIRINQPVAISKTDKKILLTYLWKIQFNRSFILRYYASMEQKILGISQRIEKEIKDGK